jgi:DNA replication protein DnaC
VKLCENAGSLEEKFLHRVFKSELENREVSRKARLLKEAGFPVYKTLENYDFSQVKFPASLRKEDLFDGNLIHQKRNIVMFGHVGTGKTHLATAIGVKSCENGFTVRYSTVARLVVKLSEAFKTGTADKVLRNLLKADLMILDEWGYIPVDRQGAQLLFQLISDSYEKRSVIITTNLEFSKWGTIFTDDQMAAAMIDRIAHHGHLILFEGESYRMKNALMKEK